MNFLKKYFSNKSNYEYKTCHLIFISLITIPVSISISQLFASLSLVYFLIFSLLKIKNENNFDNIFTKDNFFNFYKSIPATFKCGIFLYLYIFINGLFRFKESNLVYFNNLFKAEFSDVLLLIIGLLIWYLARRKKNYIFFVKSLFVIIFVLITSGIFTSFFSYNFILSFFGKKIHPQELLINFNNFKLYKTSGFLSLSLTYSGLLILLIPTTTASIFINFLSESKNQKYKIKRIFLGTISIISTLLLFFLLWLNGSRSTFFGFIFCLPFLIFLILKRFYLNFKFHKKKKIFILILIIFTVTILIFGNFLIKFLKNENSNTFKPFSRGSNLRTLIWTQAGEIIKENPIFGIGPGNYEKFVIETWKKYANDTNTQIPKSSRDIKVPVSHAHNNLLHITAVAGVVALLIFLSIIFFTVKNMFINKYIYGPFFLCSCLMLLLSGLAQCYMLDDTVQILFWTLIALADRDIYSKKIIIEKFNFQIFKNLINKIKTFIQNSKIKINSLVLFFIILAIISIPISISFCQFSMGLSIILGFSYFKKESKLPLIFKLALLFYFLSYLSDLLNFNYIEKFFKFDFSDLEFIKKADIILLLFGILLWKFYDSEGVNFKNKIEKAYLYSLLILIISGFVSVFFENRLPYIILKGHDEFSPQNKIFEWGNINLYSAQGFLSNRLTYAGIEMMALPIFIFKIYEAIHLKKISSKITYTIYYIFLLIIALFVFWLNGVRSSILGFAFIIPILFYYLIKYKIDEYKLNKFKNNKSNISKNKLKFTYYIIIFLIIILSLFLISYKVNLSYLLKPLTRLSDFGRALMWTEGGDLIKNNFWTGIGFSNFDAINEKWRNNFILQNPDTWYFFFFIPDGHLHSDIIDITAKKGFIIALVYLSILYLLVKKLFNKKLNLSLRKIFFTCSCISIFIAGLAQCYFSDEEVLSFFWINITLSLVGDYSNKTSKIN